MTDASVREHGIFLLLPHSVGIIGMKRGMNAAVGGWKGWRDYCVYVYACVCVCVYIQQHLETFRKYAV